MSPHITHGAVKFDFVNLAFQTESMLLIGSWSVIVALAMFTALAYDILIKDILLSLSISNPRSLLNLSKAFAAVFSLNFLANVRAQDSFNSHPTLAIVDLFLAKL